LQELGEKLIDLTDEQLAGIGLEESLRSAVVAARSIKAHGALRRQKQLIGKLMRRADPEPIRATLAALGADDRHAKRIFREAEKWRDRLRDGNEEALDAFHTYIGRECPAVLISTRACKNAMNDRELKAASRRLFREIHREIEGNVQNPSPSI